MLSNNSQISDSDNKLKGLVFITPQNTFRVFLIDNEFNITEMGDKTKTRYSHLFIRDVHLSNNSSIIGYNGQTRKKGIVFHLINKEDGSYLEVKNIFLI